MIESGTIFLVSFAFSYLGSVPPGAINLSVLQLSLENRKNAGLRFALAAALVEYPYAWIALRFEAYITSTPLIAQHFQSLAAGVMIALGIISLWPAGKKRESVKRIMESGFRRGLVISLLNPLAIPFWIGVTAYVRQQGWVLLESSTDLLIYAAGVSSGTFLLLFTLILLAHRVGRRFSEHPILPYIPGTIFLLLGFYSLGELFIN